MGVKPVVVLDIPCENRVTPGQPGKFLAGKTSMGASHDDGPVRKLLFRKSISIFPNDFSCLLKHSGPSLVNPHDPVPSTADSLSKGSASNFRSFTSSR